MQGLTWTEAQEPTDKLESSFFLLLMY
uniref:Uncharacterized protein n=1 Tax=Lepeophtheirus salmonis TaxID=72036 RepID=A0A0K2SVW8_LEPSM